MKTPPENLPEDPAALQVLWRAARGERDQARQRAEEQAARAQQQGKRADDLYLQNLRLQLELERYQKWYYGPRADRLKSSGELGQALLACGEELAQKPAPREEAAAANEPAAELRGVKRRKGRRALVNFDHLPVTTHLYALSAEERACPCCGTERKQIGAEESWQIEYLPGHFERILGWKEQLLPKHSMAEAVNYILGQWTELKVFCSDGAVPIDNNLSEREMKRVVLNRKNSLFVGNPRGGRTAASLASLTSSCRRHEVDPQLYLTQLLMNLPTWPQRHLDAWLPDQWKLLHPARLSNFDQ